MAIHQVVPCVENLIQPQSTLRFNQVAPAPLINVTLDKSWKISDCSSLFVKSESSTKAGWKYIMGSNLKTRHIRIPESTTENIMTER